MQTALKGFVKRHRLLRELALAARSAYRRVALSYRVAEGIPGAIHFDDGAFDPRNAAHYASVGEGAVGLLEDALASAGTSFSRVRACLDLPYNYKHVLRYLVRRLPSDRIDACDLDRSAVRFCARALGARPVYSHRDLARVHFPRRYDLIWMGSLLTHLPRGPFGEALRIASSLLEPGGVLVFTTHGLGSLAMLSAYGVDPPAAEVVAREVARVGFSFAPYAGDPGFGISISPPELVTARMEELGGDRLRLLSYAPRGWDDHQDVFAYMRVAL